MAYKRQKLHKRKVFQVLESLGFSKDAQYAKETGHIWFSNGVVKCQIKIEHHAEIGIEAISMLGRELETKHIIPRRDFILRVKGYVL